MVTGVEGEPASCRILAEPTPSHGQHGLGELDAVDVSFRTHAVEQRTEPNATTETDVGRYLTLSQPGCPDRGQHDIVISTIQTAACEHAA